MATVTIQGLTKVRANSLAILAEDGTIAELINDKLSTLDLGEHRIEDELPYIEFSENEKDSNIEHIVEYNK